MKKQLLIIILMFFCSFLIAQNVSVNGKVISQDDSLSLPGVNVVVKNTNNATVTDFDGNFTIDAAIGASIEFSYLGFKTKTIQVVNNNMLNVNLVQDTETLEEVVVIGYGTQKLSKISGALTRVTSEKIEKQNTVRVEDALQSTASGVSVISNGSPGSNPSVIIRGVASNSGTAPLVVIDGIFQDIADLNALNPNDVASINVLKDAALTAMYGVEGANGVILITTKKGGKGKTKFSFDSSYAIQQVASTVDVLNATEYATIVNEASLSGGGLLIFDNLIELGEGTNWQNEVFHLAPIVNHSINASGGSENTSYYFSGGYLSQDGIVGGGDKSNFSRVSLSNNLSVDLTNKFKLTTYNNYNNIKQKTIAENSVVGVLSNALNFEPTLPIFDENGNYSTSDRITQEVINPLAQLANTYNLGETNKLIGKIELEYNPTNNLKITNRFGYSYADVTRKEFLPLVWYGDLHNQTNANEDLTPIVTINEDTGEETSTNNRLINEFRTYFKYNYDVFANYDFSIGQNHNFETTLGLGLTRFKYDSAFIFSNEVPYNSWQYADLRLTPNTDEDRNAGADAIQLTRNLSYFARVNYNFKETYLLTLSGRYDGSTNFGENNKFGFFPAASAGWIVSNEDFFTSNKIDFLKFRASYGEVGNDGSQNSFSTINLFPTYTTEDELLNGSALGSIPNANRSWETQAQLNAGFDTRLLSNTINFSLDFYKKWTSDLLFAPDLSLLVGDIAAPEANIGSSEAHGFDISLGINKDISENLNISTNLNFTTVNAIVTEVNNTAGRELGASYGIPAQTITLFEEGYSPWYFWGYKTDGIFQNQDEIDAHALQDGANPGDIRYVDVNGDGEITDDDRTKIGDPFPEFTIGWNLNMKYKNFDFGMFTFASVGNDIYRAYERNSLYTNRFAKVLDRWTGEGTSNDEPRVTFNDTNNNTRHSDRYVEDGSYFRIKNVQLGYTIPQAYLEGIGLQQLRVYAQIKNALTFTKYSGFDPEIGSATINEIGVDRGTYPVPRIWTLGVNLKF